MSTRRRPAGCGWQRAAARATAPARARRGATVPVRPASPGARPPVRQPRMPRATRRQRAASTSPFAVLRVLLLPALLADEPLELVEQPLVLPADLVDEIRQDRLRAAAAQQRRDRARHQARLHLLPRV